MINNEVTRHIKTHAERSSEDQAAVHFLENHLKSDGRINLDFAAVDKWPNTDGRFEFVSNPDISRRPEQDSDQRNTLLRRTGWKNGLSIEEPRFSCIYLSKCFT